MSPLEPAPEPYQAVAATYTVPTPEALLPAAHSRDISGAGPDLGGVVRQIIAAKTATRG